ncbi:MAG: hypothetical protein Q9160_004499 [Pyrenula sp. 1 TL-2023]
MAHLTHPHMMLPAIQTPLTRSQSHNAGSPTSSIVSRSATDPLSPSFTNIRRSNSAAPEPSERSPRASQTLPVEGSSPEKSRPRERDNKQEKHRRLHLHTHFPHPHLHALSANIYPELGHQRSRSQDNRHRRTQTDTQTPTILVNDAFHDHKNVSSHKGTNDGSPSDSQSSKHRQRHHRHIRHRTDQSHNSKDDPKTMLRPTRPGLRPRAVSDFSRPSPSAQPTSNPLESPAKTRTLPLQRVPTTASFISSTIDRANALKRSQLESATPKALSAMQNSAAQADAELRARLSNVSKSSTEITRRLDYTYYNLLEKLGQLVTTVSSFQTLLAQTHAMSAEFQDAISETPGSGGLQADSIKGAKEFEAGFEGRKRRVLELEQRIRNGKAQAEELGGRLEVCTKRVKVFEAKEQQWREKVSMRLRIFWICVALLLALSLGFGIWWESRGIRVSEGRLKIPEDVGNDTVIEVEIGKEELVKRITAETVPEDVQELLRSVIAGRGKAAHSSQGIKGVLKEEEQEYEGVDNEDQDVLRILDEL